MNEMYYTLVYKENPDVELKGCIDLDTIDDDQPDVEYLQNDGTWNTHAPSYWKVNGEDLSFELDKVKALESQEWGIISQYLNDWDEIMSDGTWDDLGDDFVFCHEFSICNLYISYDYTFTHDKMLTTRAGAITSEVVNNNHPMRRKL